MRYYIKTTAYVLFIPLLLLIAVSFCVNNIISLCENIFDLEYSYMYSYIRMMITAFIFIVLCFLAMMSYGYFATKKNPHKPESMTGVYMPMFIPVMWYLLWTAILNIQDQRADGLMGVLILSVVALNVYGISAYDLFISFFLAVFPADQSENIIYQLHDNIDSSHYILIFGLLYYVFLIAGFAVGERHAARNNHINRKPFLYHKKKIITLLIVVLCLYSFSEIVLYQNRKNIVSSASPDHGFPYERGYSSIDLKPYYVENEENILAKLNEPSTFMVYNPIDMPVLDGAEAAYPVYSAFADACYGNIAEIQTFGKEQRDRGNIDESLIIMPIRFTNTIRAYEKLLTGEVDIYFGARPSKEQLQMAEAAGQELILTPIGKEAFVFFVNEINPVNELSSEQIKDIYSGKINNWRKVGGRNEKILAFQRPENSGSQTMMEYFMGETPLRDPLEAEYSDSMSGVVRDVAVYNNDISSLGYSFRYYASIMINESSDSESGIKFLAVDGVYPNTETIKSGEYPLTTELYAITVMIDRTGEIYHKETIEPFLEWMTGPQGQQIVEGTGYVAIE